MRKSILALAAALAATLPCDAQDKKAAPNPVVEIDTTMGLIAVELYPEKAPITVENFLGYVKKKHYDGTIFHRVRQRFMIQGGGLDKDLNPKPADKPIKNEAKNGLENLRGTIAMARTSVVDSATTQFFINHVDNKGLNHRNDEQYGYCVFGMVVEGLDVVDKIANVAVERRDQHEAVPLEPIVINSIKVREAKKDGGKKK